MAVTFAQITQVRLALADPAGYITISQVADASSLPTTPTPQTVYKVLSTTYYMATIKTSGAVPGDYKVKELYLSDATIGAYITSAGSVAAALPSLIQLIIAQIASKRLLVKTGTGAENKEYTSLSALLAFYNDLYKKLTANNNSAALNTTGKWYTTHDPEIAGGEL
jgi:hypothetical protein